MNIFFINCFFIAKVHGHLKNCFSRISGRPLYRPRRELSTTSGTVYTQVRTSTAVDFNRDSYVRDSFNRDSYVRDSFNRDSLHKDDPVSNGKAETVPLNSNESSFSGDKQENGFLMESELKWIVDCTGDTDHLNYNHILFCSWRIEYLLFASFDIHLSLVIMYTEI